MTASHSRDTIRVLLVDDQALVRSGFRIILESEPDIEVVGEAEHGEQAVALASTLRPDVVCMDVEMPGLNGIEASRRILSTDNASTSVLVLTTFGHDEYLFEALAAGVSGFLLKTARAEHLIDAVRILADGGSLLGPEVTGSVLARVRGDSPSGHASQGSSGASATAADTAADASSALEQAMGEADLTERERAVLRLLAQGRTNAEIAGNLFLGEATVKTHVSNVLHKLGVRDRLQAVVWAHTR